MTKSGLGSVMESRRANAVIGWALVAFLGLTAASELAGGDVIWAGFTAVVALLVLLPALAHRGPEVMLPWEVVALASVSVAGRALVAGETVGGVTLTGRVTTYLAVAAVALIIAVELDVFTPVRMNFTFAVFFVVIATMAAAGVWAVVKWLADLYLGTSLLLTGAPEHEIETALMWDFVAATVAGVFAGVVFEFYFRRHADVPRRVAEPAARGRAGDVETETDTEASELR